MGGSSMTDIENFKKVTKITEIRNELKEYDFEMRLLQDAELHLAIAGDGEALYLLLILLPTRTNSKYSRGTFGSSKHLPTSSMQKHTS